MLRSASNNGSWWLEDDFSIYCRTQTSTTWGVTGFLSNMISQKKPFLMIDLINMRVPGSWVPCFLTGMYLEFGTATPTPHLTLIHTSCPWQMGLRLLSHCNGSQQHRGVRINRSSFWRCDHVNIKKSSVWYVMFIYIYMKKSHVFTCVYIYIYYICVCVIFNYVQTSFHFHFPPMSWGCPFRVLLGETKADKTHKLRQKSSKCLSHNVPQIERSSLLSPCHVPLYRSV